MAHIDYKDGYFWGVGSWEERELFKAAFFTWSPRRKSWITDRIECAESIKGIRWTDRAIAHVKKVAEVRSVSRDMSYQQDTDFDPPIPQRLLDRGIDFKGFQKAGIEYGTIHRDTLIADDPGLGKTIQAIGISNCFPRSIRKVLVICPASLKENWRREWLTWCTKDLSVGIAETRHRETFQDGFYKNGNPRFKKVVHPTWWPDTDVVIINYDILHKFADEIRNQTWDFLVCDEVHSLKSSESGRTLFILGDDSLDPKTRKRMRAKAHKENKPWWFAAIEAKRRCFLSGTPMLNRPIELWPIVRAFDPDGIGRDRATFGQRYCDGWFDVTRGKYGAFNYSGASNQKELGQKLREAFMVRRRKRNVLPELPLVFRQVILLDSPEIREVVAREDELAQALKLYENTFIAGEHATDRDARLGEQIIRMADEYDFREAMRDDPDRPNARKLNLDYASAILGLEPPAVQVLFEEIAQVRRELGIAKLSAIIPWVDDFLETDNKLILFGYHSDVVLALADRLSKWNPALIYGGTPVKKRQLQVDRFQEDENCRIIIGNIHAAGVGFTMTRAADVAFAEGDWVPSILRQCEDRSCRIGQTAEKIISSYLVANGSLDSRIAQSAKDKEDIIDEVLDT